MTPDVETLRGLLERVEKATGPDREIELALELALGIWTPPGNAERDSEQRFRWNYPRGGYMRHEPRRYTASLDAALALTERLLPGWSWGVRRSGFGNPADAELWNPLKAPGSDNTIRHANDAGSAPLALLAALLSALIAQATTPSTVKTTIPAGGASS